MDTTDSDPNGAVKPKRKQRSIPKSANLKSGELNAIIEDAARDSGLTLSQLTVMGKQRDPYRLDTPSLREAGEWLAAGIGQLLTPDRKIHLRGLHYVFVASGQIYLPASFGSGVPYINTDENWLYLSEIAAKGTRWLGLLSGGVSLFDRVTDERNEQPFVYVKERQDAVAFPWAGNPVEVNLPREARLELATNQWPVVQPYRIAVVGEKTSLRSVFLPIAQEEDSGVAELILPMGEFSDTLIYDMAKRAANDPWERPLVVLYFSDFDPSGFNMPAVISRKLQALIDLYFPRLEARVYHAGLTIVQIRDFDSRHPGEELPSTPLKPGDPRAKRWKAYWGREQTEIDALATLYPDELERIAREAIERFIDPDLEDRVAQAQEEWEEQARQIAESHPDYQALKAWLERMLRGFQLAVNGYATAQSQAERKLDELEPPPIDVPEPQVDEDDLPEPIYHSEDDFVTATRKLIDRKEFN